MLRLMKDRGANRLFLRNHLPVIALVVCLCGCASAPKEARLDASKYYARELKPEGEQRAEAAAHFATGVLYQYDGRGDEALAEFEQAVQLDPSNDELAANVASEYLRRKQNEKAIGILEKSGAQNPDSVPLLYMLGYAYKVNNQVDKSITTFLKIVKLDPTEINAYQNLVSIYVSQNKREQALKLLNTGFKQKTDDEKFWAGLGDMFASTVYEEPKPESDNSPTSSKEPAKKPSKPAAKDKVNPYIGFSRALECYEKATRLAPDDEKILNRLADLYVVNKHFDKAVPIYLKILEQRPNSVNIREKLALSYVAQDDKKKAIAQIEEIVKKEPLKFKFYMMLGELYLDASHGEKEEKAKDGQETEKTRLLNKALDKFQQAVVLNSNEIEPQLNIAYIYLLEKKTDQSVAILDKAKEKFPTNPKLFYFYGLAYSDMKQYDKAKHAFADALSLVTDSTDRLLDSSFYFYYGAACERAGDIEGAAEQFRKSIDLNPENAESYNYLGYMWADKGIKLNEALDYIKKALEFEPDNGAYVDSLGWIYFKQGKYEDALQQLLRANSLMKEPDPAILDHIAEVYMRLGKKNDALQQWKKANELDPTNKEISEKLKHLQTAK